MQIAYLIIAYDQPRHLERMVLSLAAKNTHFYVHIDKKSDINMFHHLNRIPNLTFSKERISVNHGGWSLTQTMVNLLQESSKTGYDYYQFLSGRDYPIKSNEQINTFLEQAYHFGTTFINFYQLQEGVDLYHHISNYFFVDKLADTYNQSQKLLYKIIFTMLKKIMPRRQFVKGLIPYRGSQWCCLHRDTAAYVIDYLDKQYAKLHNFFRYSWGSDELFFQTIILNSDYRWKCHLYEQDSKLLMTNENKAYLHYIDWDPGRGKPAILNKNDFTKIGQSDFFFARKFDKNKSKQLLSQIDHDLLRK